MSDLSQGVMFPIGEKLNSDNFNGTVRLHMLTPGDSGCPIGNVTFEPGCRNHWHKHRGGQILLVSGGSGYYHAWGEAARELHPGDVMRIPAAVKRWHGAAQGRRIVCGSPAGDAKASPEAVGFVGAKCGFAAEAALHSVYGKITKFLDLIVRCVCPAARLRTAGSRIWPWRYIRNRARRSGWNRCPTRITRS